MPPIPPNVAAMLNRGMPIGTGPQQQKPPPFRERMLQEIARSEKALAKAKYALDLYDNNNDIRNFILHMEGDD